MPEGLQYHPAASLFPLATGKELKELAADIKEHGLQIPIELFEGKIIDGRCRYLACETADVEPDIVDIDTDDPIAYVLSLNLHRRHLSVSQRALIGAEAKKRYSAEAKERRDSRLKRGKDSPVVAKLPERETGRAREKAAEGANVSPKTIDQGSKVLEKACPELLELVNVNQVPVSVAARLCEDTTLSKQKQIVAGGVRSIQNFVRQATQSAKQPKPKSPKVVKVEVSASSSLPEAIEALPSKARKEFSEFVGLIRQYLGDETAASREELEEFLTRF